MDELISVIVPIYNGEKYLPACVESLLNQTYQAMEIILVNDGSKDSSGEICDGYAERDSRVRVIHQPNQGVSAARNAGLDLAAGKYVAFVDADDYVLPDYLERLHEDLINHDADFVACDYQEIKSADGPKTGIPSVSASREIEDKTAYFEDMVAIRENYWSIIWAKLYRRELIGDTRFCRDLKYGEDHIFFYDLMCKGPRGYLNAYQGYCYVRNESSVTVLRNASNVLRCENEMNMCRYKLQNLPADVQQLKGGFRELYGHSIHNMARALALSGTAEERRKHRKDLCDRITECFREEGGLSGQTAVFLKLYYHLPSLYNLLIRAKVKARGSTGT